MTRRPILVIVASAVLLVAAVAGIKFERRLALRARLPPLPEVPAQQHAVRDHLQARFEDAQSQPSSTTVGELCLAYHADMFLEHAVRCYAVVQELAPDDWRWQYYRALIDAERGRSEDVLNGMQRVVELASYGPAWWCLGDAAFKQGRYDRAREAWTHPSIAKEPERTTAESPPHVASIPLSAYAALGLARIALVENDPEGARTILEPIVRDTPRFGPAFRLLAESYGSLGRPADAERMRARAARLPPYAPYADPMGDTLARESRNSTFLLRQASDADLTDNAPWSEMLTRRALEFDPENPDVIAKLGRILRTLHRSDEALSYFVLYNQKVPGDFQGVAQIGSCLLDLGRLDEAEPFVRQALEGLDDALTHYNLGLLLSRTGRVAEAVIEYRRALERNPDDVDARGNLAVVLLRQRNVAAASQELRRVLEIDPENVMAHVNLGLVLAQQGQRARAVAELRTALQLDPDRTEAAEALRELER